MSKVRSDSIWNSLPPQQREQLEHWLFVENISYKEASERALKEWGVKGSSMSVARFYKRVERQRVLDELEEVAEQAVGVSAAEGKLEELRSSAMKLLQRRLVENVMSRGDLKELAVVGRVLAQVESRETQRDRLALARENQKERLALAQEIQRGRLELARETQKERLALAREKFQFKAAKTMLKNLPLLNKMKLEDQAREDDRIDMFRLMIFGKNPVDEREVA